MFCSFFLLILGNGICPWGGDFFLSARCWRNSSNYEPRSPGTTDIRIRLCRGTNFVTLGQILSWELCAEGEKRERTATDDPAGPLGPEPQYPPPGLVRLLLFPHLEMGRRCH